MPEPSVSKSTVNPSPVPSAPRWTEITATVASADAELASELLACVAPGAVSVESPIVTSDERDFSYTVPDGQPAVVCAYLAAPLDAALRADIERRIAEVSWAQGPPMVSFREVEQQDWSVEWRRFFTVLHVGKRLVVRPSWEPYAPRYGEVVLDLDPGAAFGTGQHETTRLCLEALERSLRSGSDVLDVGTGSGILAVAAARLGARSVRAIDVDPGAIDVARATVQRNGVDPIVTVAVGSLGAAWPWHDDAGGSADVAVANISSAVVIDLLPELARALRSGGSAIVSGFLADRLVDIRAAAAAAGLRPLHVDGEGDWRCLTAVAAP